MSTPSMSTEISSTGFLRDVIEGLSHEPDQKRIPSRYLYDERGCELFDAICQTPEYYPTRTETAIMRRDAALMAEVCGARCRLIELGSGSSEKTEVLLDHLDDPAAYVPVDFAEDYLQPSVARLRESYPQLRIEPVCADFSQPFDLPNIENYDRTVVYFPGSTIGNLHHPDALQLLKQMRSICGQRGGMLIGMDLKKDASVLEEAYNDRAGVTAEFTSNLLARLKSELHAELESHQFEHLARYNPEEGRIEIYLCSAADQVIRVAEHEFEIEAGELINTEYSYKYDLTDVQQLARDSSWALTHVWMDDQNWFGVFFLSAV